MQDQLLSLIEGRDLSAREVEAIFDDIFDGKADPILVGGMLTALQGKWPTESEVAAAAKVMRRHVVRIDAGPGTVLDTCGTGGGPVKTFNISTAAAIVCAASGVRVVKHGSRAATSKSGSADVLESLGLKLDLTPDDLKRCLHETDICFAFAHQHHPAMKWVAPVRRALGVLTIFNLLGPLTNPAGSRHQLMGVTTPGRTSFMAGVLQRLGSQRAWVVCSDDGLDELATWCPATIAKLENGVIREDRFDPAELGLTSDGPESLRVDSPAASAEMIQRVFNGEAGGPRDIVLLNAAAGLVVADGADDLAQGLDVAAHAIDSGRAGETLERLVTVSRSEA